MKSSPSGPLVLVQKAFFFYYNSSYICLRCRQSQKQTHISPLHLITTCSLPTSFRASSIGVLHNVALYISLVLYLCLYFEDVHGPKPEAVFIYFFVLFTEIWPWLTTSRKERTKTSLEVEMSVLSAWCVALWWICECRVALEVTLLHEKNIVKKHEDCYAVPLNLSMVKF